MLHPEVLHHNFGVERFFTWNATEMIYFSIPSPPPKSSPSAFLSPCTKHVAVLLTVFIAYLYLDRVTFLIHVISVLVPMLDNFPQSTRHPPIQVARLICFIHLSRRHRRQQNIMEVQTLHVWIVFLEIPN